MAPSNSSSGEWCHCSRQGIVRLTQEQFAQAMGISVHTLRNWEQDRRKPDGPAIALLRIAARHPLIIRENLTSAA
jgi:putative transcriptional regulator